MRNFYDVAIGRGLAASHLAVFAMPNVEDVAAHLLGQDVIWVWGGSVAGLLAMWRMHGIDSAMRAAWNAGVVLTGTSAGSICWHVGGPTDSYGPTLRPITEGLALVPYSNGVHYDSEEQRRPLFQSCIADGTLPAGYAARTGWACCIEEPTSCKQSPSSMASGLIKSSPARTGPPGKLSWRRDGCDSRRLRGRAGAATRTATR